MTSPRRVRAPAAMGRLGTFGGVFTPSLLTILGLVLFLRVGYVTGNVGLGQMLLILGLATAVSVLTTISLAAIATNLRVGGGGVYFLISRTLGPAFGGAIGIVLYLAMSVSIAFYTIGLGEALAAALDIDAAAAPRIIAAVTIVALLGLAWLGADIATRLQYVVMVALVVAIVAYFVGVGDDLQFGRLADGFSAARGWRHVLDLVRVVLPGRSPGSPRASPCPATWRHRRRASARARSPRSACRRSSTCW